jgi:hypothetical protein
MGFHQQGTSEELKPAESIRVIQTEDGAALLDVQQGVCFSLNKLGIRIWEFLKADASLDDIASNLATEFHVPRAQILQDITEFANSLAKHRLLIAPPLRNEPRWRRLWNRICP